MDSQSDLIRTSIIFGTRPEAIKLAPVILALNRDDRFAPHLCVTGQHREMLDQVMDVFELQADVDLSIMRADQSLSGLTARALCELDHYLENNRPDLVIVQGDTTTAFCAALSAFYRRIPIAHVEAGLRTGHRFAPFPEEINRVLVSQVADWHFAPTQAAVDNLLQAGLAHDHIFLTGNTVIDALQLAVEKVRRQAPNVEGVAAEIMHSNRRMVLITGHRRENFGRPFEEVCRAIAGLAETFQDVAFVYPVHLNPNVREPVHRLLNDHDNIVLIEPLPYLAFIALMDRATVVLTDSGGVQEEAPSLGKPVLVMRERTERPEAVAAGTAKLVGTDAPAIHKAVADLLTDKAVYERMSHAVNPYGDGRATERIVNILASRVTHA
ncbi:UDP-N-acetylglucosamine 2-epimerase (non-hydrolyzing) [Alsobacter sp. KACC 23698]|uniref:UDP-N-acetylglucosamine 2-epimerase (non-hydrolyzing) n=1 Tax=Alsobacter sp. KACC 23698 TaxID=3149229 RepID=A0AAU7JJ13_9HYPH